MKKNTRLLFLLFLFTTTVLFAQKDTKFAIGLKAGYNMGFAVQTNITAYNVMQNIPVHMRFAIGFTSVDPGSATEARRIFINNATNGTPNKKGQVIDYKLDFLVPFKPLQNAYINVGPRYSNFKGNFEYVGGNENFDVTSSQWGFGAGIIDFFKINSKIKLEISAGLDYFIANTLTGHDTSYSPDDENINPREDNQNDDNDVDFTFKDANEAINQPKFTPHIMIGLNYKL